MKMAISIYAEESSRIGAIPAEMQWETRERHADEIPRRSPGGIT